MSEANIKSKSVLGILNNYENEKLDLYGGKFFFVDVVVGYSST